MQRVVRRVLSSNLTIRDPRHETRAQLYNALRHWQRPRLTKNTFRESCIVSYCTVLQQTGAARCVQLTPSQTRRASRMPPFGRIFICHPLFTDCNTDGNTDVEAARAISSGMGTVPHESVTGSGRREFSIHSVLVCTVANVKWISWLAITTQWQHKTLPV